jgi:hypothetical protein
VMKLSGNRCQCTRCGTYFNRVSTFDKHRIGRFGIDRRCMTAAEMAAKGWRPNAAGFMVTGEGNWRPKTTTPQPEGQGAEGQPGA